MASQGVQKGANRRAIKWLAGVTAGTAAAVAAVELLRRWFRHSCLFAPSPLPLISWNPGDYGLEVSAVEERIITTDDGCRLYAWYCRAPNPIASVLHCHGNGGNLTSIAGSIRFLVDQGLDVLLFDYRGYGRSEGKPSIRGVIRDARAAAREHDELRRGDIPSILYGYSLGGAIAAQITSRHQFDALVLQSTFTTLGEITHHLFPGLPFHRFCGAEFDTRAVVSTIALPLLVIHGSADRIIPCRMGRTLYEVCCGPKTLEIIEGAAHKDVELLHAPRIAAAVERFIRNLSSLDSAQILRFAQDDALRASLQQA